MPDDIMKALSESYNRVSDDAYMTEASTLDSIFGDKIDVLSSEMMKLYDAEEKRIEAIKKAEAKRFETLFKNELKAEKFSQKVKADLLKQENDHYTSLYNLKQNLHKKEVTLLEDERKIRQQIAQSGKVTLGDLASLYTKQQEIAKLEKETLEYKEQQFKKGVDTVKQAFGTIIQHIMNYVNEWDNLMRWNQWEKGIKDSGSQYEQNFTEIAGRLGYDSQLDTHTVLKDSLDSIVNNSTLKAGLNFNNEVFPAITEAVQKGFTTDAEDIAISNAIDKKIMPWLETSSETWVQMQYNMSDEALLRYKSDQLMLQATQEGNRLLQNGVISQITDSILPSLDNIVANTTEVEDLNDEMYAKVMYLMNDMGYSKQEAIKAVNKEIEAYQNPFKALTSGDTGDKLLAIDNLWGTDLVGNFASSMIGSGWAGSGAFFDLTGLASGGETRTERGLLTYAGMESAQNKYIKQYNLDRDNSSQYDISKLLEYTTATQQHDNTKQNLAAEAVFDKNLQVHGIDLAALQLNELKEIKTWLITGLSVLLLTKLTDKLTDGFVKNVLSKFKGGGSSSGGGGILKNLTAGGKGSSKITQAMNSKLSGAALIAGGALVAKEGIDVISESNDILNDKTSNDIEIDKANKNKVAGGVAIAGGTVAAGAGIASLVGAGAAAGPIGWAALAIGGLALGAKALNDHFAALSDGSAQISANFDQARQSIELERQSREDQLLAIKDNLDEYDTTTEKLQYLQQNGINVNEQALKDVNGQLDIYLNNLIKANDTDAATAENMLTDIEAKLKNDTNQNLDDIKQAILDNYSAEQIAKDNKLDVKKDADKIWNLQKTALKKAGYSDSELSSLYYHWNNGAADKGELEDFLDSGAVQGDNIGSFEDHYEKGKIKASGVNYLLEQSGYNNISMIDYNQISSELGPYAQKIATLKRWKDNKNSADYSQEIYDQYKQDILNLPKDYKSSLTYMFESIGEKNAMSDWPNSLKGFKLGSTYIPYDMLAMVHAGERVLTAGQNKEYTNELTSGNSTSSIIQAGVQDIVMAIKTQTSEIINYLSTMSFNNSSFGSSHINMLPAMGNTKVTL